MKKRLDSDRGWLTPQEVGNLVGGFSAQFIRTEIKAGELDGVLIMSRLGKLGRWRIRREAALAYAERLRQRHQTQLSQSSI